MEQTARMRGSGKARSSLARPGERGLGLWIDPRTKVLMLAGINVVLLGSSFDVFGMTMKSVMALVVVFFLVNAGKARVAAVFVLLFTAAAFLETANEQVLLGLMGSTSIVGLMLRFIAMLMLQFIPGTMFAYAMIVGTKVSEFVAAMEHMRLSQKIIIPFAVIFRFFPTVAEEYSSIKDAMRMRGLGWRNGPVAMIEYRLVPLIVSIVKIGDELSAASVTRGLGGDVKRTNACRVGFGPADIIFVVLIATCVVATVSRGVVGW